ncbi:MAG TPA: hypothetical protein VHL31_06490 [Geminicoccus sp.]|uniref:hypothetical protein n=1 Tax=Geminicoccus sp. TaxID=2024832 RepID=UPI002E379C83|nr:hypothetical protein [Geminicoccus sp.]HEX2525938.1 hypothetical protein [Geminicoccus sp.]
MGDGFAISALVRKRADLAGEIEAGEARLRVLRASLAHVDATIRLFSPTYPIAAISPKKPRPKQPLVFGRGDLARSILDILRTAQEPMTVAQIAAATMRQLGLPDDLGAREFLESRVDKAVRRQADQGLMQKVQLGPRAVGWAIARVGEG